jgi:hypothetical protein
MSGRALGVARHFRLNEKVRTVSKSSEENFVRNVQDILKDFEFSHVVGAKYNWRYLPDEVFHDKLLGSNAPPNVHAANFAFLSHLFRIIEAFEVLSIWRARDLVESCVRALNNDCLIAAATLARSLLELAVHYGFAANTLRGSFEEFKWEQLKTHILILDEKDEKGQQIGLESYIERLMGGTRIKEVLQVNPAMEQKNILTIIDKTDKGLDGQGMGYRVRPHYDFLCDIAHPNTLGFQRFLTSEKSADNGWIIKAMEEKGSGEAARAITGECLWALGFGAATIDGMFDEFQKVIAMFQKIGPLNAKGGRPAI